MDNFIFEDFVLASYAKHYNADTFLQKVKGIAIKAGSELIYKTLLLYYVLMEGTVPFQIKTLIIGALGYLVLPTDLIPDFIVGLGYTDDLAAITFVVSQIEEYRTEAIERKAKKMFEDIFDTSYDSL